MLTGRGPCTQPMWQCRARPCALTTSDAAGGQVPVCPEPFYCLDDYCGGCNHICASEVGGRWAGCGSSQAGWGSMKAIA